MVIEKKIYLLVLLFVAFTCEAKIKLPSILGNHMVLQQLSEIKLWGWGEAEKPLFVETSWNSKRYGTRVRSNGTWEITINTEKAGGPYSIEISDGDTLSLQDIYLGEVWLCSGQSNMGMPVRGDIGQPVINSLTTIANADSSIPIRMFNVGRSFQKQGQDDCQGKWCVNSAEYVSSFSAVAYFFGMQLYQALKVPIGLVQASCGSSNIQSWMPAWALEKFPSVSLKHLEDGVKITNPKRSASMLFNGMIYPIKNYFFKGVIWYQGESNQTDANQYADLFMSFVKSWRTVMRNDTLPFYYAQISPYSYGDSNGYNSALIREAQYDCARSIANVGMAVLMDVGSEFCIHPPEKQTVGKRLSFLALEKTYQKKGIVADSPRFSSAKRIGNSVLLFFEDAFLGITSYDKSLEGFELAGDDGVFYSADARIIDRTKVQVKCDKVDVPVYLRYAFKNYIKANLFGGNGLPVSSFRIKIE